MDNLSLLFFCLINKPSDLPLQMTTFQQKPDVNTLRLSLLFVPSELIVPSETTWLNCTYDLENDHLYAIQWYKIIDGKAEEFYRYSFRTNNYLHNFSLTNLYTNFFVQFFSLNFFISNTGICQNNIQV